MDVTVDTVLNELTDKIVEEREVRTDTVVSSCGEIKKKRWTIYTSVEMENALG